MTYFEGSPEEGVPADDEAKRIWQELGVADDHIIKGDKKVRNGTGDAPIAASHYTRGRGR